MFGTVSVDKSTHRAAALSMFKGNFWFKCPAFFFDAGWAVSIIAKFWGMEIALQVTPYLPKSLAIVLVKPTMASETAALFTPPFSSTPASEEDDTLSYFAQLAAD